MKRKKRLMSVEYFGIAPAGSGGLTNCMYPDVV